MVNSSAGVGEGVGVCASAAQERRHTKTIAKRIFLLNITTEVSCQGKLLQSGFSPWLLLRLLHLRGKWALGATLIFHEQAHRCSTIASLLASGASCHAVRGR